MIGLFADESRSGFGIATALDIEGIPYRRLSRADEFDGRLLVIATRNVPPGVSRLLGRVPAVIVGPSSSSLRAMFAAKNCYLAEGPVTIPLRDPIWPATVRQHAQQFGKDVLSIPRAPVCTPDSPPAGTVLASLRTSDGKVSPAVVSRPVHNGSCSKVDRERPAAPVYWSLIDIGAAFTNLLDEEYRPQNAPRPRPLSRAALALYYRAPDFLRRVFQQRTYAHLNGRIAQHDLRVADYPVDATGWLLIELLKALVRRAAGALVRLEHWPAPYNAAAVLTHDLEPSQFAYTRGLSRLLVRVARSGHPATLGFVARSAVRYLGTDTVRQVRNHDIVCHGLEHRGETVSGSREAIARQIGRARRQLEEHLRRSITGFRSPRLDRSPDLLWALDRAGYQYDSSYPDVDRENASHFGAGVRLNLPFRPPIMEDLEQRVRPSACLELPMSAPDCIQPLFEGRTVGELGRAVREKLAFIRATGGLYVGNAHAGVFGARDSARRGAHLGFMRRRLQHPELWLASASEIADWWCVRERLGVSVENGCTKVTNHADRPVDGVRLVVETNSGQVVYNVPSLGPGENVSLDVDTGVTNGTDR